MSKPRKFCVNNHELAIVGHGPSGKHCKGCLEMPSKMFCIHGHNTLKVGRNKNGNCLVCKDNSDRNTLWKSYRIRNADGSQFTFLDYDRAYQIQQGRCAICAKHQGELKRRLDADHSHSTGIFRALLCSECNNILGRARESIPILAKAIGYLKRHRGVA